MSWTLATQLPSHMAEDVPRESHHLNTKACPSSSPHRGQGADFLGPRGVYGIQGWWYDTVHLVLAILKSAAWILTGRMSGLNGQLVKAGPKCFFLCQIPNYLRKWDTLIGWSVHLPATDWVRTSVPSLPSLGAFTCWTPLTCSESPNKHSGAPNTVTSQAFLENFLYTHTLFAHVFQNHSCDRAWEAMSLPSEKHFSK